MADLQQHTRIELAPVVLADGKAIAPREKGVVKMKASGICGTDVMQWYRIRKGARVLGHEMAGEIVAIDNKVTNFKRGDRVFVSHHVPCYSCHYCTRSKYSACELLHSVNYEPGGFAEFIRVPEENVRHGTFVLPKVVTFEEATMIEPLGCVIAGQNQLDLKEGQSVLVIGSGVSGLLHIQLSRMKGAKVIVVDINEYKLTKALEFGADAALNANTFSVAKNAVFLPSDARPRAIRIFLFDLPLIS